MAQFTKRPIDGDRQAPWDLLNLLLVCSRIDLDADRWQTHHMLILEFLCKKANASVGGRSFGSNKILLEESVCMYEVLRVLGTVGSQPNALLVRRPWYKREDLSKVEKPSPWKDTATHTTLCRILCNAQSSFQRLIIHF
jgi:hypothetical protein